jgi:HlyD family secretion protein
MIAHRPVLLAALLALAACSEPDGSGQLQGYVEGDYLLVGAQAGGRIEQVHVQAGDQVEAGAPLVELDPAGAQAGVAEAEARLAAAKAQLADLEQGRRPEEIAVIEAQIAEAAANLAATQREFERVERLPAGRVVSASALDQARMAYEMAKARVGSLQGELEVARLPARTDAIAAARHAVEAAAAALAEARWQLEQRRLLSPAAAVVEEVFFRPGEVVSAGQPLLALLPPGNRKLRFFVPEPQLAGLRLGQAVAIACDGCPAGLTGRIGYIATEAEFTPPVIFSVASRQKLVFKVEAVPEGEAAQLKVGQPIDVTLAPG